jgi:hypothetical protein
MTGSSGCGQGSRPPDMDDSRECMSNQPKKYNPRTLRLEDGLMTRLLNKSSTLRNGTRGTTSAKEIGCEGVYWIHLGQNRDPWRCLVRLLMCHRSTIIDYLDISIAMFLFCLKTTFRRLDSVSILRQKPTQLCPIDTVPIPEPP